MSRRVLESEPEIDYDRPAGLWRVVVAEEPVRDEVGLPAGWLDFTAAYRALEEQRRLRAAG